MWKCYDALREHIEKIYGEKNIILNYIEDAFDLGREEGESIGFKEAMSDEGGSLVDIDDVPESLFDEMRDIVRDEMYDSVWHDARDEGYSEGYDTGKDDGYESGYESGYNVGLDDGYNECKVELGVE